MHTRLLRFVFAQSYAKSIGDTSGLAPAVRVPGLAHDAAAIPLDWHAAGALAGLAYPVAPAPAPADARWWHALAALLYGAFGVQRLEPANVYNPHRGYPSARGRFPVHAYLVHEHGALCYDPVGHRLQPVAHGRGAGLAHDLADDPIHGPAPRNPAIVLAGCFDAFPPAYGPLRYALTVLEAGHALYNLVLLASALGLAPAVRLAFADQALLARLGLPPDGSWAPLAMVALGQAGNALADVPGLRHGDAGDASTAASGPEDVHGVERATWLAGPEVASFCARTGAASGPASGPGADPASGPKADPMAAQSGASTQPLPPCPRPRSRSLGELLYARNAGRASAGLCGRAVPISAGVLHAAAAALEPMPGIDAMPGMPCNMRILFAAERIDGLDDGIYELAARQGALAPVRRGRWLDAVQAGLSNPPSSTNLRSMNLVWFLAVDYPAVLARWGARGLRLANLAMGWVAQGLCCAAAAEGLFARPVRSFREPVLDDLLGLGPTEMIAYQILCGKNRFTDFLFDLRPPATAARGGQQS